MVSMSENLGHECDSECSHDEREWFYAIFASIGYGVISADLEGKVTFVNRVAETLTGWPHEEACGKSVEIVFRPCNEQIRESSDRPAAKVAREGGIVGLADHSVLIARDGTELPIEGIASAIQKNGKIARVDLVFRKSPDRSLTDEAERKNKELLQLIHKIGKIGHWEWNSLTDENKWSPEIEALYGLPPGGFEGGYQGWTKLLHPDDLGKAEADVRRALESGEYFTEFRVVWPDGSVHWLETRANVFKDGHDKPVRIMGVNMDVTERKRNEEELRQTQKELQQGLDQLADADRRKDEFLATLAHELRNPLAPIRHGLDLMQMARGDPSTVEMARQMIDRQFSQLVRLVDDLMDVSRISRGKIELRKEQVQLAGVIDGAVETSRPLIEQMGHQLTVTLPRSLVVIDADFTRLSQVFVNLLNNAAKYTPRCGHISLTAERQGSDLVVSVKDTGLGIAAAQLPCLFTMFSQLDHPSELSQGGLGVGLTLVKRLVEMHGGRIEARSEGIGKGSEFIVRLPIVVEAFTSQALDSAQEQSTEKSLLRILIVDDNEDGANSLSLMLKMGGNDTRAAYDGEQAVAAADEFRPNVILLDIGLPRLTGYEACRRIREQPWGKEMVIIAQTGWGQEDDRRRTHEAGFDYHMVKPLDRRALAKLLAGLRAAKT